MDTTISLGARVNSSDYGNGTVIADLGGSGIQVYWDKALSGTIDQHILTHDRAYVLALERL